MSPCGIGSEESRCAERGKKKKDDSGRSAEKGGGQWREEMKRET